MQRRTLGAAQSRTSSTLLGAGSSGTPGVGRPGLQRAGPLVGPPLLPGSLTGRLQPGSPAPLLGGGARSRAGLSSGLGFTELRPCKAQPCTC